MLLNTVAAEDLTDPNNNQQLDDQDDRRYLMYKEGSALNWGVFRFDDRTRQNLGLKLKEFGRV